MSDSEEILEVFYSDIENKERQVFNKFGGIPFIEDWTGFSIEHIYGLSDDDLSLLARVMDNDDWCAWREGLSKQEGD